jgi:hypothetical protein
MNCKQGDLAVIVRSSFGNEGKIVRCVKLFPKSSFIDLDGQFDAWQLENPFKTPVGLCTHAPDLFLRPIRPSDEPDETLSWCDVPSKVLA